MTYEQFEALIKAIQSYYAREAELNKAIDVFCPGSFNVVEFCPELTYAVTKHLKEVFNDEGEWIDYWLYELDGMCGEDAVRSDLEAYWEDGSPIPLRTCRDLYDLLIENNKK